MYRKTSKLTDAERVRLDEITFCNFIDKIFTSNSNPAKVYGFIEVVCTLSNCDLLVINNVVSICMTQDRRYRSSREELIYLLTRSDMAVRRVVAHLGISQRDYYNAVAQRPPDVQPKFTPKQYIEMIKFLNALDNLIPERIG